MGNKFCPCSSKNDRNISPVPVPMGDNIAIINKQYNDIKVQNIIYYNDIEVQEKYISNYKTYVSELSFRLSELNNNLNISYDTPDGNEPNINEKNENNYLLASDWDFMVYIWNLDDNYKFLFKITTGYTNYIYSLFIYFKLEYIITSTVGHVINVDYIKIFSLKEGKLINNIKNSELNDTLDCLIWEKEEKDIYIVACCYQKIEIYNILTGELYGNLATEINDSCGDYYFSGFIANDNKHLFTSSYEGFINIWDLYEKKLIKSIKFSSSFFKIIPWSIYIDYSKDKEDDKLYENFNNYILICDKMKNGIYIINFIFRKELNNFLNEIDTNEKIFYKYEVISFFENNEKNPIKNVKKFKHPILGEAILTSGEDQNINLWVNNSPLILEIFKN